MNFDSDMLGIGHAPFRVVLMAPIDLCVCVVRIFRLGGLRTICEICFDIDTLNSIISIEFPKNKRGQTKSSDYDKLTRTKNVINNK